MWDSVSEISNDQCNCTSKKTPSRMNTDVLLEKENMVLASPAKNEELSLYDKNSPSVSPCTSPFHCRQRNRRPLEDHDTNSQDSGYIGKFSFKTSPTRNSFASFDSGSSMDDDFLEGICDFDFEEKQLPKDFDKLIGGTILQKNKTPKNSPNDTLIRPMFRRALSLQTDITPPSSKVRSCLFKTTDNRPFKRPDPPSQNENSIKRSKIFEEEVVPVPRPIITRSISASATEESIKYAVQVASTNSDLIGDFSKNCILPLTKSRHDDLKAISPYTLTMLMKGEFHSQVASFKVIDCRYPYEFEGGHIDGAINIYTREQCLELLQEHIVPKESDKRHILVFHCEFSSERGPNLYRFLRQEDRHKNENFYPSLNYPEIYLLEGGYKNFFENHSEFCVPTAYKTMLHPDHKDDLRHFRQKSKTWNADSRKRGSLRFKRL